MSAQLDADVRPSGVSVDHRQLPQDPRRVAGLGSTVLRAGAEWAVQPQDPRRVADPWSTLLGAGAGRTPPQQDLALGRVGPAECTRVGRAWTGSRLHGGGPMVCEWRRACPETRQIALSRRPQNDMDACGRVTGRVATRSSPGSPTPDQHGCARTCSGPRRHKIRLGAPAGTTKVVKAVDRASDPVRFLRPNRRPDRPTDPGTRQPAARQQRR